MEWIKQTGEGLLPGYVCSACGSLTVTVENAPPPEECKACGYYRAIGLAAIDKTPEPMRVLRPLENGQFVACFAKKAQPDFEGTLSSGRSVMFEAKTTRTGKIDQSAVTKEQGDYLDAHGAMNALCFVVVSFGDVYAVVPWPTGSG